MTTLPFAPLFFGAAASSSPRRRSECWALGAVRLVVLVVPPVSVAARATVSDSKATIPAAAHSAHQPPMQGSYRQVPAVARRQALPRYAGVVPAIMAMAMQAMLACKVGNRCQGDGWHGAL